MHVNVILSIQTCLVKIKALKVELDKKITMGYWQQKQNRNDHASNNI